MPHTIVALKRGRVDVDAAALAGLAGQLAPSALAGADDLAGVPAAFHAAREVAQVETFDALTGRGLGIREGRTLRLVVTLGVLRLQTFDATRVERAHERLAEHDRAVADLRAQLLLEDDQDALAALDGSFGRQVTAWSRKSRARMVAKFASIDYRPLLQGSGNLALVTWTYPDGWQCCTPTGRHAKKHLDAFRRRYQTAGWDWIGLWKEEFQERGAAHFHGLLSVPAFAPTRGHVHEGPLLAGLVRESLCRCSTDWQAWARDAWADVVSKERRKRVCVRKDCDHVRDEFWHRQRGVDVSFSETSNMTDHKRIAVYFLKHSLKSGGSKEYQHVVPALWQGAGDGPGRFWGFWGLEAPEVAIDLDREDFFTARRVLRRAATARARHIAYQRARAAAAHHGAAPAEAVRAGLTAPYRAVRSFGAGGSLTGGWLVVNDGIQAAMLLGDYLRTSRVAFARPASPAWGPLGA